MSPVLLVDLTVTYGLTKRDLYGPGAPPLTLAELREYVRRLPGAREAEA